MHPDFMHIICVKYFLKVIFRIVGTVSTIKTLFSLISSIEEQKVMIAVYALISLPYGVLLFEYYQVNGRNI